MAEKLSLVNPDNMDIDELKELIEKTEIEHKELMEEQQQLYKEIRGKLWLWWILPIFGWVIYISVYVRRKTEPENADRLVRIKKKLAEKEIQQMFNQRRMDHFNNK